MAKASDQCPTLYLLHLVGKRWTIPILEAVDSPSGKMRFNNAKSLIGAITPKNLSRSLKELSKAGIIEKMTTRENKIAYSEYSLTQKGLLLQDFIKRAKELGICLYHVDSSCANRKCTDCMLMRQQN